MIQQTLDLIEGQIDYALNGENKSLVIMKYKGRSRTLRYNPIAFDGSEDTAIGAYDSSYYTHFTTIDLSEEVEPQLEVIRKQLTKEGW